MSSLEPDFLLMIFFVVGALTCCCLSCLLPPRIRFLLFLFPVLLGRVLFALGAVCGLLCHFGFWQVVPRDPRCRILDRAEVPKGVFFGNSEGCFRIETSDLDLDVPNPDHRVTGLHDRPVWGQPRTPLQY